MRAISRRIGPRASPPTRETIPIRAAYGRPKAACRASIAGETSSFPSSVRRRRCSCGGRSRGLPYAAAAALWLTLLAIAALTLILCALYGSRERITAASFLAAAALAIAFGPITSDFALGQIALLAFAAATLLVTVVDRSVLAAAAAAVVAFAQPNVALGLASQLGRIRALAAIGLGALVTYGLGALALGPAWPLRYASAALAHGAAERFVAIQITPAAIAYGFGLPQKASWMLGLGLALLALAAGIALVSRVREPFARFAGCSALVPFVTAFVHEHDLVVAYVAALWCALRTRGATRVVAFTGTLLVCIDWLGLAQRPTGIAQSALLALAAAAAFAALAPPGEPRASRAILPIGALFAVSAWLAIHHPAPVWPGALGLFHAPHGADARSDLAGRAARERTARGRPGLGLFANASAARLRAVSLRYISTSMTLSNGVSELGWKFFRSLL